MSETWTSLSAALVGAIVGGAASLAGTMLVNKKQMATNARMRMYDELLPRLERVLSSLGKSYGENYVRALFEAQEVVSAVSRASSIAGRRERKASHKLMHAWLPFSLEVPLKMLKEDIRPGYFMRAFMDYMSRVKVEVPKPAASGKSLSEALYDGHNRDWDDKRRDDVVKLRDEIEAFSDHLGAKLG
jgi:hypothetical protein